MFQKYDPRVDYFDSAIATMTEVGLIDRLFKRRTPYLGMKEYVKVEEEPLIMEHFYVAMMILAAGSLIGALVVLLEKFGMSCCHRRAKNLLRKFA